MTAARRLVTDYLLVGTHTDERAAVSEIRPGALTLLVSASRKTLYGFGSLVAVQVQKGESSALRKDGPDPIDSDETSRLAWIGKLICLLTAVSTSSTIVWAMVSSG
jgi:hypothetical protein